MEEVVAITVVGNSGILVVIERYVGVASLYNELISVNGMDGKLQNSNL